MEEAQIETPIHQYDESIRNRQKSFDNKFPKKVLSVPPTFINDRETIESQLYEKTKECEQLKEHFGRSHDTVAKLYSKYEDLNKHYRFLLKNNHVEEFLKFAILLKTRCESNENTNATLKSKDDDLFRCYEELLKDQKFKELTEKDTRFQFEDLKFQFEELRLQFEERNEECRRLNSNLNEANDKIFTLDSELKTAQELLNQENLQRKQIESERDNFSEKLRSLMLEYQRCVCRLDKTTETNTAICCDNSISSIIEGDSDLVLRIDTSTSEDDLDEINFSGECGNSSFRLLISPPDHFRILPSDHFRISPPDLFRDWNVSAENIDSSHSLSKKDANVPNKPDKTFIKHIENKMISATNELPNSRIHSNQFNLDCDIGEKSFLKNLDTVEEASRPMHKKKKRQSEKCGKSFEEKNKRQKLMKLSTCDVQNCNTRGEKRTNLEKNHKFADTGTDDIPNQKECQSSDFYCNICDKHYSCKNSLNAHKRNVHRGEKPYKCNECGKQFIGKSHLKDHSLTHGSLKPFKCSVCGKCFNQLSNKNKHERTIHEGEAFQCAHCNKRYSTKISLIGHINFHHFPILQKQFKCTVCGEAFVDKNRLNRHKLIHTSEKPLKCSICDERFKYHANKIRHERKVHKDDINYFPCAHCDKMYSSEQNLSRHLQKKHVQYLLT